MRAFSWLDKLLIEVDHGRRSVLRQARPACAPEHAELLSERERRHAGGLMRVNHAGEVAAQGLYRGQALTARSEDVKRRMAVSAEEESDHLAWCNERLARLDTQVSRLGALWYLGSVAMGAAAGLAGDHWSLGFVRETERQVVSHLERHLARLPRADAPSRAVLERMLADEARHAQSAATAGAAELPQPIRRAMTAVSRVMTATAYYL